ncbi:hypothetical protein ABZY09_20960 [Streptomyces sp. NPDC002928]|uniref:hypothetical protein n=1 Tax=Streptomyces sp. NPDC002928 TaxID=3154440 RepID=UPI0033ACB983
MRRTTVTAVTATALLLVSCGTQSGDDGGAVSPPTTAACASNVQLSADDDGHTVCVTKGGQVRLTLDGTRERPWKPVTATGGALRATNAGIVVLPGDATAAYDALATGTAKLTSARPLCPQSGSPGHVSCQGIQEWTVTVRVR